MARKPRYQPIQTRGAKAILDLATGDEPEQVDAIKATAAALGRKGGKARAASLTPKKRSEIAKKAAAARWKKK